MPKSSSSDPHPQLPECREGAGGRLGVLQQRGLGDLEREVAGLEPGLLKHLLDLLVQVLLPELAGGEVHAHRQRRPVAHLGPPAGRLRAGLAQHPGADPDDQAALLGQGDELAGRDQAALRVLPAHQGLDAAAAAIRERHQPLVVQAQLASVERALERSLGPQALEHAVAHRLVEQLVARAAQVLGAVHRGVRVLEQVLRVGVGVRQRHADARGDQVVLAALEPERCDQLEVQALGEDERLALVGHVLAQDYELVPSQAGDRVTGPQRTGEALGDLDQHPVALRVAEAVVHELEPVEVDEQHPGLCGRPRRSPQRQPQAVKEERAVGQAGERVVERLVGDLVAGAHPLRHTAEVSADLPREREHRLVRLRRVVGEDLDHGDRVGPGEHGNAEPAVHDPALELMPAREVQVPHHVLDPHRLGSGDGLAGEPLAGLEHRGLADAAEVLVRGGIVEVPDPGRDDPAARRLRDPGVTDRPVEVRADAPDGRPQDLLQAGGVVGGGRHGLKQLELALAVVQRGRGLLRDPLRLVACPALTLETAPQAVDLAPGGAHANAISSRQRSSPCFMHRGCSIVTCSPKWSAVPSSSPSANEHIWRGER